MLWYFFRCLYLSVLVLYTVADDSDILHESPQKCHHVPGSGKRCTVFKYDGHLPTVYVRSYLPIL